MKIHVKISVILILSLSRFLSVDFIKYAYFAHTAASSPVSVKLHLRDGRTDGLRWSLTLSDDVTYYIALCIQY